MGSINLVCAGIESYQSTTAFALTDAASGGSAQDSIDATVGSQKEALGTDSSVLSIFDTYLTAMKKWATAIDKYQLEKQSENLTAAREELENEINGLASQCEANGWKFVDGWRA